MYYFALTEIFSKIDITDLGTSFIPLIRQIVSDIFFAPMDIALLVRVLCNKRLVGYFVNGVACIDKLTPESQYSRVNV